MTRILRFGVFITLGIVIFTACGLSFGPDDHPIKLTFINTSDSLLCFNSHGFGFCDEVKPRDTSIWRPGCGSGKGAGRNPITVVLSAHEEGIKIYQRTATCNEWEDSGGTFLIKQRGDDFIVTDSLPDTVVD